MTIDEEHASFPLKAAKKGKRSILPAIKSRATSSPRRSAVRSPLRWHFDDLLSWQKSPYTHTLSLSFSFDGCVMSLKVDKVVSAVTCRTNAAESRTEELSGRSLCDLLRSRREILITKTRLKLDCGEQRCSREEEIEISKFDEFPTNFGGVLSFSRARARSRLKCDDRATIISRADAREISARAFACRRDVVLRLPSLRVKMRARIHVPSVERDGYSNRYRSLVSGDS